MADKAAVAGEETRCFSPQFRLEADRSVLNTSPSKTSEGYVPNDSTKHLFHYSDISWRYRAVHVAEAIPRAVLSCNPARRLCGFRRQGLFRSRCQNDPGRSQLELLDKAELLPPELERERRFWRSRRGWIAERLGWRLGLHRNFSGWKLQQIVKIQALASLPFDVGVFLDSDVFLCAPVTAEDFVTADGEVRLFETQAETYWDLGFEVARQLIVGRSLSEIAETFNYVFVAQRFRKRTAERLLAKLHEHGPHWYRRLIREPFLSEYALLGWTARVLEGYEGYIREPSRPDDWLYDVREVGALTEQLRLCREERGRRKFFLIQSHLRLPISSYRDEVLALLSEFSRNNAERLVAP